MGWFNESAPGHEGYLVGLVPAINRDGTPSTYRFRELDSNAGDDVQRAIELRIVQVACECGWRSPRLAPPLSTCWAGYVEAPEYFRDDCCALWSEHIARDVDRVRLGSDGLVGLLVSPQPAKEHDGVVFVDETGCARVGVVREQTSRRKDRVSVAVPAAFGGCDMYPVDIARCRVIARHQGVR